MDNRLKRQSDFDQLFKKGKRCYGKTLMLLYLKKSNTKVGYSVSKKNGGAVIRNSVKRKLRAVMRDYIPSIDGYHIVIVPRPAENYDYFAFKEDLNKILKKENLLND